MVMATHESLKSMSRDFASVSAAARKFVLWANEKLQERVKEIELEVESALASRRRKKTSRPGEIQEVQNRFMKSQSTIKSWTQLLRHCTGGFWVMEHSMLTLYF